MIAMVLSRAVYLQLVRFDLLSPGLVGAVTWDQGLRAGRGHQGDGWGETCDVDSWEAGGCSGESNFP
jgi:hypothetical protein